jgi:membrane protease YdiL (CAAX protease family)
VNIVVAGLFLGVVYLKTASLWWATGAHLGWNWALGFLADGPVSGLDLVDAPGYRLLSTGPEWLSGGAFGAEGSLMATAVLGAGAVFFWNTRAVKPGKDAIDVRPLILSIPGIQPEEDGEGNMEMNDTWRAT